ncbi:Pan3 protein [Martiniozyma asiatica (nom. inval.)]|nr:Pan3 protein [Martiniozyma asiatica]
MNSNYQWTKDIACRHIREHGFCKFENKGCTYNHDLARQETSPDTTMETRSDSVSTSTNPASAFAAAIKAKSAPLSKSVSEKDVESKLKFKFDSPSFTPSTLNKFSTLSPSLENIPTFIPSSNSSSNINANTKTNTSANTNLNTNTSIVIESNINVNSINSEIPTTANSMINMSRSGTFNPDAPIFTPGMSNGGNSSVVNDPIIQSSFQADQQEEIFYQNTNMYPANFHLYGPPPPPHIELNKKLNERVVDDLFIDRDYRNKLQKRNEESLKSVSNNQLDLPIHVNQYHSLYPIDRQNLSGNSYGYQSMVYKCMSNNDGLLYCLRRLKNVPITSSSSLEKVKCWKKLDCANIIKLHEVFTTRAFGDNSLILIYDYYPLSFSLLEYHFGHKPELITEECLWNYTIQMVNAITEANNLELKFGHFLWSKILVTTTGRIRVADIGLSDILNEVKKSNADLDDHSDFNKNTDKSDLENLGELIISLARVTLPTLPEGEDNNSLIDQLNYSQKFKDMLAYILAKDATIERLTEIIAPQILKLSNGMQNKCDYSENLLMKELENARLVRLFAKLDFISERPELIKDKSWSETGDRYPLKLFRSYIFHQYENNLPRVDLTHVVDCLNKLDAGVDEKILLVSPDEMNCMIISYKSLKELLDKSFHQLITGKFV